VPEGVGAGHTLVVSVGLTHSDELEFGFIPAPAFDEPPVEALAPVLVSYAPPTVTAVVSRTADEHSGTAVTSTAGGDILEVHGDNFGVNLAEYAVPGVDGSQVVAAAPPPLVHVCERSAQWDLCDPCIRRRYNHTFIECTVPAGVGANKYIRVTVAGQANAASEPGAAFSYAAPVIDALSSYDLNTGADFDGVHQTVTVTGRHFGSPSEQLRLVEAGLAAIPMLRCV
jgi:hypothetical protein